MKKNIPGLVFIALCFLVVYSSCSKIDTTDLGNDLIPAVDNVNTFETVLDVQTDNQRFIRDTTQMPYNLDHAVGLIDQDPDFGKTEAELYFDVAPSAFKVYPFGNRDSLLAVDSIILSLAYKSVYGDSNSVQRFDVFEVNQAANFKYSNTSDYRIDSVDVPVLPTPIGTRTFDFKILNDSVRYVNGTDTIRTINELRIPISTALANRFIAADTSTAFSNDSIFKTFLKGLAVKASSASPSKNALAYFDLTDEKTKLTFHCRVKSNGNVIRTAPFFRYFTNNGTTTSSIGAQANFIKRTPANGYLAAVTNSNTNDQVLYIQSTPGSYATIKIPGIDTLTNRVIHRAELVMEKIAPVSETFGPSNLLFLDIISPAGDTVYTIPNDFVQTGNNTYDVNILGGRLKDDKYLFNISRHIQNIVTNKARNYTLRVHAPFIIRPYLLSASGARSAQPALFLINPSVGAGRVILGGGTHPTRKMRLRIIYSKI